MAEVIDGDLRPDPAHFQFLRYLLDPIKPLGDGADGPGLAVPVQEYPVRQVLALAIPLEDIKCLGIQGNVPDSRVPLRPRTLVFSKDYLPGAKKHVPDFAGNELVGPRPGVVVAPEHLQEVRIDL